MLLEHEAFNWEETSQSDGVAHSWRDIKQSGADGVTQRATSPFLISVAQSRVKETGLFLFQCQCL